MCTCLSILLWLRRVTWLWLPSLHISFTLTGPCAGCGDFICLLSCYSIFSSCQPTAQEQPSSRKHSFTFGHSLIVTDFGWGKEEEEQMKQKVGGGEQREKNALGMVMYVFNLSTMETEAGRALWVWGQSDLHSEFHDSQGYIKRSCLKNKPTKEKAGILTLSRRSCLIFSLNWKESTDVEKVNIQF